MASGPWDNVQLAGPPNGPAWIQAAAQMMNAVGQNVGQLGNAYQSGKEFNYQQNQRNFFQDPNNQAMLNDALKKGNYAPLMQAVIQQGGTPALSQAPGIQRQLLQNRIIQQDLDEQGGQRPPNPTAPAAGSPDQIVPQRQNVPNTGILSASNTNDLAKLADANGVDLNSFLERYPKFQPLLDESLTPAQKSLATAAMLKFSGNVSAPNRGGINSVQPSGPGDQAEASSNQLKPSSVQGGPPISPAPTSGSGNIAPATTFNDRFNASRGNPPLGASAMVPPQWRNDPQGFANYLRGLAADAERKARTRADAGLPATADENRAKKYNEQATEIEKQIGGEAKLTPEQQNLRSGATQRGEELKGQIAAGQKDLEGYNKLGNEMRVSNQKVQLAKSLLMSPDFYSGPAEGINRTFKQWTATLGGDPNKGTPQEAFRKTVSDLLSEQIRAMASSGVGRVLLSEVQQMQKGIASLEVTPSTNRLLLEEVDRVQKAQTDIQDKANAYAQRNGHLDEGFNREIKEYYQQHPLFSARELRDPRLIAPARMPQSISHDPVKIKEWARSNGLKSGDPFAGQDGSGPYKLPAI